MRALRPYTTRLVNPITRSFAGWLPGFGLLTHVGRTSGRAYRIPINVFPHGDEYLFALTYGSDVQWVKNVVAAGGCEIRVRGRDVRLVEPLVLTNPDPCLMPLIVRLILRFNRVNEFMLMRRA
jgi:deazaflavin-dependent oxidoreductase (nitroreductase family)